MNDDDLARQLREWSTGHTPISCANPFGPGESSRSSTTTVDLDFEPVVTLASLADGDSRSLTDGPRKRSLVRAALVALVVVVLAAAAVRMLGPGETDPADAPTEGLLTDEPPAFRAGPCPVPQPRPTGLSDVERAAESARQEAFANESWEEGLRTGFAKFSTSDRHGGEMCGWVKVNRSGEPNEGMPTFVYGGGQELYDGIEGNLMGIAYPYLGFFTLDEVAAAGFDPITLRLDRYGCDPLVDAGCSPPGADSSGP